MPPTTLTNEEISQLRKLIGFDQRLANMLGAWFVANGVINADIAHEIRIFMTLLTDKNLSKKLDKLKKELGNNRK